ncbi:MAG: type II secretion system protein N [Nitrospirota bacterium]
MKSGLFTERNIFYLNILIGIFLILSTLFLIRDIISNYFYKEKTLKREIAVSKNVGASRQKMQLTEYSSILKNNPFGFSGEEIRLLTASMNDKAQKIDIELIGTVVGPKKMSYGVFMDRSGMQDVFKVGDSVFGLGKLYSVKKDKVLLRQGEKTTEILLEDVKVKEIKRPASGEHSFTSTFAQKVGRGTYIVDQGRVQQAISNPNQIMTDARLKPNIINGKQEGFILSEVKPGGIYHSLGLQNGDVLLRINEYEISNPERALQAFTALKGLERVQIDLIRGGSKMTMTYQIK